jgi:hypothetical protein
MPNKDKIKAAIIIAKRDATETSSTKPDMTNLRKRLKLSDLKPKNK